MTDACYAASPTSAMKPGSPGHATLIIAALVAAAVYPLMR
jgi:hypothetical protein